MKQRLRLEIQGTVQGVGFRPFVYQWAKRLGLTGWVNNSASGVTIEIEGRRSPLTLFLEQLQTKLPSHAKIDQLKTTYLEPFGFEKFEIKASESGQKTAVVLPDLATCSECITEIFDPQNRRYHYPFTNCTHCGPRYSIIETLPYDRRLTTMADFPMCADCQREYEDAGDRRFHAQPNACPNCGPQLEFWLNNGSVIATKADALKETISALKKGNIIALKGLGGFQLIVDARNKTAVENLRDRKQRPDKSFAVMFSDLEQIQAACAVSLEEKKLLCSAAAPIVLLQKKNTNFLAQNVAPNNPYLGAMLPYTPLHHLLLKMLDFPVIATSGNLSDEPICIDEIEALARFSNLVDGFLVHNRQISRPVDDSVVRVMHNTPVILRRSRGYAPEPFTLKQKLSFNILAVGSHLKNTVAIAQNNQIFLSQHIGDLSNQITFQAMENTLQKLSQIYDFQPDIIACDSHPDYLSTQYAKKLGEQLNIPVYSVQHHHAHIYACIAEHHIDLPVLGIAWDGTGYGEDGTIWGGEFFLVNEQSCQRIAHLKPFPLIGGDHSSKEPRRSALGLLSQLFDVTELKQQNLATIKAFSPQELNLLTSILEKKINSPLTSSMGRIFDAIASLLDLHQIVSFEGQGAMALEFLIGDLQIEAYYNFDITNLNDVLEVNLKKTLQEIIRDLHDGIEKQIISAKFHNTLVEIIVKMAQYFNQRNIVLTGGCFQNKYLLERSIQKLEAEDFKVYYPQKFPCNDGGIALGQVMAVIQKLKLATDLN